MVQSSAPREIDCFTIILGKKTGKTFPVDIHNQKVNALYDTGAGCSLINYSMYETLGIDLDEGYQLIVKSSKRENMGALGQVTYTFTINGTQFTQSFIVCRHMTRHMILGRLHSHEFHGCHMDKRKNMETDAFQWDHHHGTTRFNHRSPAGLGLFCQD